MRISKFPIFVFMAAALLTAPAWSKSDAGSPKPHAPTVARTHVQLRQHFERAFQVQQSPHFAVVHDTAARSAKARVRLLEHTHSQFFRSFADAGFDLRQLTQPLVCVLFANADEFAHYAQKIDLIDMSWSGGYYSARTNRVALFDEGKWYFTASGDEDANVAHDDTLSAIPAASLASTTHEAAHQIAFNSGLQRRGVMYPLWASEGIATNFEAESPNQLFGPEQDNPTRRSDLIQARAFDRLLPLRTFVTMTHVPTHDPEMVNAVYAQTWALFRYLYLYEQAGLKRYLAHLASLEPGRRSQATLAAEFEAAFGSIERIDAGWQKYVATME